MIALPEPDYGFYGGAHAGALSEEAFEAALPLAMARLRALVGPDATEAHAEALMHAACALADRVAGLDRSGELASETVGSTSVAYAQASQGGRASGDYDAVLPWLAGTGLLCRALGVPRA